MVLINPFEPIVLKHPDLSLTAHVIPLGVNVTRLVYKDPQTGQENDVIVGPENPRDHWEKGRKFLGPMIGRYANRLPAGNIEYEGGSVQVPEFCEYGPSLAVHVSCSTSISFSFTRRFVTRRTRYSKVSGCRGRNNALTEWAN